MSTFETEAPRTGRWVRRGPGMIVIDDLWGPEPSAFRESAASAHETGAYGTNDVAWLQSSLNRVTGSGLAVDGVLGPQTRAATMAFQSSEGLTADGIAGPMTVDALRRRMSGGASPVPAAPGAPASSASVGTFDAKQCASWLIPYLAWARQNGWQGRLNSGWRDPVHSEGLCLKMCGAPTCPGRCAGRRSNHSGSVKPNGAIDVSDEIRFGQLMARCPLSPPIFNDLPNDRVHFSATGH
jgi:hypothetical protein